MRSAQCDRRNRSCRPANPDRECSARPSWRAGYRSPDGPFKLPRRGHFFAARSAKKRSIFLFQDDDFPLFGPAWRRWARDLVGELHRNGLPGRVAWKINCRADAVEPQLFTEMREAGLYMVYMGLESGTEEGLKTLHKQISVEQNIRAVEILKQIGALFEYGFMLLDPSSTFDSVRA